MKEQIRALPTDAPSEAVAGQGEVSTVAVFHMYAGEARALHISKTFASMLRLTRASLGGSATPCGERSRRSILGR